MRKLAVPMVASVLIALAFLGGCGGDSETGASGPPSPASPPSQGPPSQPQGPASATPGDTQTAAPDGAIETRPGGPHDPAHATEGGPEHGDEGPGHTEPPGAFPAPRPDLGARPAPAGDQQGIEQAVRSYIGGLNAHDGKLVCRTLAPSALTGIDLPVRRGGCAASVTASIGFAEPGGQPEWRHTRLVDSDSVVLVKGGGGRLTGTVVHLFRGSREPSIEDDVIYLERSGSRWLIAQPSTTFYRAIGVGDVPLSALTPPRN